MDKWWKKQKTLIFKKLNLETPKHMFTEYHVYHECVFTFPIWLYDLNFAWRKGLAGNDC